jgi:hypothetical protein
MKRSYHSQHQIPFENGAESMWMGMKISDFKGMSLDLSKDSIHWGHSHSQPAVTQSRYENLRLAIIL